MPLILWSGGADSTLVLHDALAANERAMDPDPVRTISITHPNIGAGDQQRTARDAIQSVLSKRFAKFDRLEVTLSGTTNGESWCQAVDNNGGIIQPGIWLTHAALALRASEDLYAGYVKGDDVWHYRPIVFDMFRFLQAMTHRTGSLVLPLEWTSKANVLCRLKHVSIYKHVWYCEEPENGKKGKPCGRCGSCKTHRTAVWQIDNDVR